MLKLGRVLVRCPAAKDRPRSGQHRVHGRTGSRKELNQASDCECRETLFNDVVKFAKVEFPIENVNSKHQEESRKELRQEGLCCSELIRVHVELGSTKGIQFQSIGNSMENWKGHQATPELSHDTNIRFSVRAFTQREHLKNVAPRQQQQQRDTKGLEW